MRSPTQTGRATQLGVIQGTAAYMAPEQAKGRLVDRRVDIWAFGVILHEMLSGRRLFEAGSIQETLAHVITREADLSTLPADTPPHLRTLIARCLVKDPKQRLRDVGEARLALDGESTAAASGVQPLLSADHPRQAKRWRQATAWTFVALLGGAAAYQVWSATRVSTDPPVLRLSIPLDVRPALFGLSLALAPDGHALVVQASWSSGDRRLFLRRLNGSSFEPLPGTENAAGPFWSPDSGSIAFVVDGQLKRIDLATSSVRRISSGPQPVVGAAWGDGTILLAATTGPLSQVAAGGGDPTLLTLDTAAGEIAHGRPVFLPDGRRYLYESIRTSSGPRTVLASLDSDVRSELPEADLRVIGADETHLVYRRGDAIYGQRVDYGGPALLGEPTLLSAEADANLWDGAKEAVSRDGLLAFFGRIDRRRQFTWYARTGVAGQSIGAPAEITTFDLSPDERSIAAAQRSVGNVHLWLIDVTLGTTTRLTVGETRDVDPRWMLDGRTLLFGSMRDRVRSLHRMTPNGEPPSLVWKFEGGMFALDDISSDGRWVLHHDSGSTELRARLIDPVTLPGEASGMAVTVARELTGRIDQGQFSPDRRWVAYAADGSGRSEVIVVPFPATGERFQVSRQGGVQPVWREDGRELYFLAPDGTLVAVPILARARLCGRRSSRVVQDTPVGAGVRRGAVRRQCRRHALSRPRSRRQGRRHGRPRRRQLARPAAALALRLPERLFELLQARVDRYPACLLFIEHRPAAALVAFELAIGFAGGSIPAFSGPRMNSPPSSDSPGLPANIFRPCSIWPLVFSLSRSFVSTSCSCRSTELMRPS